ERGEREGTREWLWQWSRQISGARDAVSPSFYGHHRGADGPRLIRGRAELLPAPSVSEGYTVLGTQYGAPLAGARDWQGNKAYARLASVPRLLRRAVRLRISSRPMPRT